jgi:hypothetical protein
MTCPLKLNLVGPLISKYRDRVVDLHLRSLIGCLSLHTRHSVLATPLATMSTYIPSHLAKTLGTPISSEMQNPGARLTPQETHQLGESDER